MESERVMCLWHREFMSLLVQQSSRYSKLSAISLENQLSRLPLTPPLFLLSIFINQNMRLNIPAGLYINHSITFPFRHVSPISIFGEWSISSELGWIYIHMNITRVWLNRLPTHKLVKSNCTVYNYPQSLLCVIAQYQCVNTLQHTARRHKWYLYKVSSNWKAAMKISVLTAADFFHIHFFSLLNKWWYTFLL